MKYRTKYLMYMVVNEQILVIVDPNPVILLSPPY